MRRRTLISGSFSASPGSPEPPDPVPPDPPPDPALLWLPSQLNPALWLDAQDLSEPSPWTDSSGNGNNATTNQGTVTLAANSIGSFQAVDFSSNGRQQLATHIFGTNFRIRTDLIVCRANAVVSNCHIYGQGYPEFGGNELNFSHGFYTNADSLLIFRSNNTILSSDFNASNNTFIALHHCYENVGAFISELWINGELSNSSTDLVAPWTHSVSYLGKSTGSVFEHWNGSVGMAISTLSAAPPEDIDRLFGYAAHRWNLASVLPSAHPYKSSPPTMEA